MQSPHTTPAARSTTLLPLPFNPHPAAEVLELPGALVVAAWNSAVRAVYGDDAAPRLLPMPVTA